MMDRQELIAKLVVARGAEMPTFQGLVEKYMDKVLAYRRRCREIHKAERDARQGSDRDYQGSLDWSKGDYEWSQRQEAMFDGMEELLGLSSEEVRVICEHPSAKTEPSS